MWVRHAGEDGLAVGLMAHVPPQQRPPFWLLDLQVAVAARVAVALAVLGLSRHVVWT